MNLPNTDNIKIRDISIINGKNDWSQSRTNLIHMVLELGLYEDFPSNLIPNFSSTLKKLIPSLYEHRCSKGCTGGFFQRLDEGTWLGHIIEHIALELQTLAGMETGWGRTRSNRDEIGVYNVIFSYVDGQCGKRAAIESVEIVKQIIDGKEVDINKSVNSVKT